MPSRVALAGPARPLRRLNVDAPLGIAKRQIVILWGTRRQTPAF
jgi:hypothetical protein